MLGAPCSPCCGCSVQAYSEIHERIWKSDVTLTLTLGGYEGQQAGTFLPLFYGKTFLSQEFSVTPEEDVSSQVFTSLKSQIEQNQQELLLMINPYGVVFKQELAGPYAWNLVADMSAYGLDQIGGRTAPRFVYEDGDHKVELTISANESVPESFPQLAAEPGSRCRIRTLGSVFCYRKRWTTDLSEAASHGVTLSGDTDYAHELVQGFVTNTISSAVVYPQAPFYFPNIDELTPGNQWPLGTKTAFSFGVAPTQERPSPKYRLRDSLAPSAGGLGAQAAWESELVPEPSDISKVNRQTFYLADVSLRAPSESNADGSASGSVIRTDGGLTLELDQYQQSQVGANRFRSDAQPFTSVAFGGMYSLDRIQFANKGDSTVNFPGRKLIASGSSNGKTTFGATQSQTYTAQSTIQITWPE